MPTTIHHSNTNVFRTSNIKEAALVLSELDGCDFRIGQRLPDGKFVVEITIPSGLEQDTVQLSEAFRTRRARADLFRYNNFLNRVRDSIALLER
jgi:hypothetical protein